MLAFVDFSKLFPLETDANKLGLEAVLSQKQIDGQYHLVAYVSHSLNVHEHNYHLTKQDFLALKWAIMEQFQEYLLWKSFVVKNDNDPLIYIMTTPNLDATWHHWVESLARFTFSMEYQKGWDNAAIDALSWVTSRLDAETVKSILDRVTLGLTGRADAHDPVVAENDEEIHKQVQEAVIQARAAAHMYVNLHLTDWVATQWEDPVLKAAINWISNQKVQNLKHLWGFEEIMQTLRRKWPSFECRKGWCSIK